MTEDKLIQSKIDEESKIYGDILQIEKPDFYRNLTVKLTALFLNWLYLNCAKVDFVFKVDDDVYVNVRNFVQLVQTHHPSNHNIIGSAGSLAPNRSNKTTFFSTFLRSKWGCVYFNIVFRFFSQMANGESHSRNGLGVSIQYPSQSCRPQSPRHRSRSERER